MAFCDLVSTFIKFTNAYNSSTVVTKTLIPSPSLTFYFLLYRGDYFFFFFRGDYF